MLLFFMGLQGPLWHTIPGDDRIIKIGEPMFHSPFMVFCIFTKWLPNVSWILKLPNPGYHIAPDRRLSLSLHVNARLPATTSKPGDQVPPKPPCPPAR